MKILKEHHQIIVRLIGTLRRSVDKDEILLPLLTGDTIDSVLRRLIEKYPELDQRLFDKQGQLHRFLNIFLDDKPIIQENLSEYKIQYPMTITLMMVIGGGKTRKSEADN